MIDECLNYYAFVNEDYFMMHLLDLLLCMIDCEHSRTTHWVGTIDYYSIHTWDMSALAMITYR
jgi:hypothetical protein